MLGSKSAPETLKVAKGVPTNHQPLHKTKKPDRNSDWASCIYRLELRIRDTLFPDNLLSMYNSPICKISNYGLQRIAVFCKFILNRYGLCI